MRSSVPVDGADAGHAVVVTHSLQQQPVSDLPGEHGGVGVFQMQDSLYNSGSGHFGLRASNHSWYDASCLIVPEFTVLISAIYIGSINIDADVIHVYMSWNKVRNSTEPLESKKNHTVLTIIYIKKK